MDEYVSKDVAAKMLGLGIRRIMDISSKGERLPRYRREDPATRRETVMFLAADVEKLKAEWTPKPAAAVPVPVRSEAAAVGQHFRQASVSLPIPVARPWLTLAEAQEYSGLPAAILLKLIESGKLRALDVGVRPGGRYRVRRAGLDGF